MIFPDISEAVNQARAIATSLGAECWRKADCFSSIPLSSSFQAQLRSRQGGPGMRWRGGLEPLDGVTPQPPFPSARAPTAQQGRAGGGGGGGGGRLRPGMPQTKLPTGTQTRHRHLPGTQQRQSVAARLSSEVTTTAVSALRRLLLTVTLRPSLRSIHRAQWSRHVYAGC